MAITIPEVLKEMKQFTNPSGTKRNPHDYPPIKLRSVEVEPWIGIKSLIIKAVAIGSNEEYHTQLQFLKIEFSDKESPGMKSAYVDKKKVYFKPIDINRSPAKFYCSCSDARFTWSWELSKKGGWIVSPKKYTPVAPPSGRPPRNPLKKMGVCKHLWTLILALENSGIIKK